MINYPDFFLVGAAKAGTTALQQALDAHPSIYMSPLKEPNFFCDDILTSNLRADVKEKLAEDDIENWINSDMKSPRWRAYLRDKDLYLKLFNQASTTQKRGEASVSYLYSKTAAQNIYNANPNAKIIIVLRNPAERAFSHFGMEQRMGWINSDFNLAFEKYKEIKNPIWGRDLLFVASGLYTEQIRRYTDVFQKDNLCIILYDEFKQSPENTLAKIYTFIGVDLNDVDLSVALRKSNEARDNKIEALNVLIPPGAFKLKVRRFLHKTRLHKTMKNLLTNPSTNIMSDDDRTMALNFYKDDIKNLEHLLNIDLSIWKK